MSVLENQSSYRSIFKATSLFGGLQLYQILIIIIKSKIVAVLLGPLGIGIQGLLTSGIDVVKTLTNFGLSQSAIREISQAYGNQDEKKVSEIAAVIKKLVWLTGLLGCILTIFLSPLLSKMAFGNYDYTIPFIFLSVTLLFEQLSSGQKVVIQGMRKLKELAKASACGVTIGLIISLPIYYFIGIRGIVPTLILNSLSMFFLSWYYSKNIIKDRDEKVNIRYALQQGRQMLVMGISMSVSNVLITVCAFILRSFISHVGNTIEVGLYTAGFTIITTYFSMIFNAMATDYYPKLAAVNQDNSKCRKLSNEQGEIASLIMTPLLLCCLVFMPIILQLLYSNKFSLANDFMIWAVVGMLFKLSSWLVAFQFIAKGESKMYIINEFVLNGYTLLLSLWGYFAYGLKGLGIAYTISNILYFIQVYIIAKIKYEYSFSKEFKQLLLFQNSLVFVCLIVVLLNNSYLTYIVGPLIIIISLLYSFYGLNKRLGLFNCLKK